MVEKTTSAHAARRRAHRDLARRGLSILLALSMTLQSLTYAGYARPTAALADETNEGVTATLDEAEGTSNDVTAAPEEAPADEAAPADAAEPAVTSLSIENLTTGSDLATATGDNHLVVTVGYEGLDPEAAYSARVELMDQRTAEASEADAVLQGEPREAEDGTQVADDLAWDLELVPEGASGTAELDLEGVDLHWVAGASYPVRVTVAGADGAAVATRTFDADSDAKVNVPAIASTLAASDGASSLEAAPDAQAVDAVAVSGLPASAEITVVGALSDADGDPIASGSVALVAAEDGTAAGAVAYPAFDATGLEGTQLSSQLLIKVTAADGTEAVVAQFPSSDGQAREDEPAPTAITVGTTAAADDAKSEDATPATTENPAETTLNVMSTSHNATHSLEFDQMDKDGAAEGDGVTIENLSVHWISSDSAGVDDGDDSLLSMKSDNSNKIPAVANIDYTISGTGEYQPGDIRIYIPYPLLLSESSEYLGSVIVIDSPNLGLPRDPDTSKDFNYQVKGNYNTGYYIEIKNTKTLSGAVTGTIPVEWDVTPPYVKDSQVSNAWYAFMEVNTAQGNQLRQTSDELRAVMDTSTILTSATKNVAADETGARKPVRVSASSLPADMIPERYRGESDFVIVDWTINAHTKGNKWFELNIEDALNADQDGHYQNGALQENLAKNGFIYKVKFGSQVGRVFYQDESHITITRTYDFWDSKYNTDSDTDTIHIYSAYPASQFASDTEYIFHNDVSYTLLPGGSTEEQIVKTASKSISYTWHKSTWDETTANFLMFKYGNDGCVDLESYADGDMVSHNPDNQNKTISRGASSSYQGWYGIYGGAINGLQQGEDQELWYTVYGGGLFIPLTLQKPADSDLVEGGWQWAKWDETNNRYVAAENVGSDWINYATYNQTTGEYDVDLTHTDGNKLVPYQAIEGNYLKRPVTMVTEGLPIYLGGTVVNEDEHNQHIEGGRELTPGTDYVFTYLEVGKPKLGKMEVYTDEAHNPSWGYATDTDISKAPITYIQVEVGNTWQQTDTNPETNNDWFAKVDWSSGKPVTTYADGTTENSAVVKLPENCTNIRKVFTSRGNASVEQNVYPCLRLIANSDIKAIADASFTDSTGKTVYSPSLFVYNGGISKPYLWNNDGTSMNANHESTRSRYGEDRLDGFSAEVAVYPSKSATFNSNIDINMSKNQATIHYTIKVEERSYLSDPDLYQQAIDQGLIQKETKGVWYDLLPEGMILDRDSVALRDNDTRTGLEVKENWNGTGRTLVIVKANLVPQAEAYKQTSTSSVSYWKDVPTLTFDATMDLETWIDLGGDPTGAAGGISCHNVVAFESGNDTLGTVEHHAGELNAIDQDNCNNDATKNGTFSDVEKSAIHAALEQLATHTATPSFVYSECTTNVAFIKATLAQLSKSVRVNDETSWGDGLAENARDAYVGGKYEYRLRMMNDTTTSSKDLVFFDSLENFKPSTGNNAEDVGAPTWRGTLVSVDTSDLARKVNSADQTGTATCKPVVYYSTTADLVFADTTDASKPNAAHTDLSDSSIWSTTAPADLSTVTAIAIDCSKDTNGDDFVLEPNSTMYALVKMHAPQGQDAADYIEQNAHAYNNLYLVTSNSNDTGLYSDPTIVHHDYTKVGLKEYEIPVKKVWSDGNDRDCKRPTKVEVTLMANGVEAGTDIIANNTIELNASNSWTGVFKNMPYLDSDGNTIDYTVAEKTVPDEYRCTVKLGDVMIDGANKTGYIVTNTYTPESTTVTATKTWVGDDPTVRPAYIQLQLLKDNQLVTQGTDWDHPLVNPARIEPDEDGNWPSYTFKNLYKNENGQPIQYEVREVVPDDAYLSAVTDNGDNTFDIVNTYHPYGDVTLTKRVVGATTQASQTEFEFVVSLEAQVTDADGNTSYATLSGEYDWESTDGTNGKVGDQGTLYLTDGETVTIKDLPRGTRVTFTETEVEGYTAAADGIASTTVKANNTRKTAVINVYYAKGEASLTATKKLEGAPLKASRFRFELVDEDSGRVLRTTSNLADGTVDFGVLEYTKADDGKTYHYIIREVVPADATNASGTRYADAPAAEKAAGGFAHNGTVYDTSEYKATVSVADTQGNGKMDVNVQYDNENRVFTNTYEATGEVALNAWKVLDTGGVERKLQADEFEFELVPVKGVAADGTEIAAANMPLPTDDQGTTHNPDVKKNSAQGVISFDAISFDQDDIDNTYYYVAYEVPGNDATIVYTEEVFGYKVTVVDNNDGTIAGIQSIVQTTKTDDGYTFGSEVDLLPVFINKLQPGGLRVWKYIEGENPNPDQEFTFKVKLTGEHVEDDAVYDIDVKDVAEVEASDELQTQASPLQLLSSIFLPTPAQAATGAVLDQGEFGVDKQAVWKIYEDGELVVSPKGSEATWDRTLEPYPWISGMHANNKDLITKITFKETIHVKGALKYLLKDMNDGDWPNQITSADMRGLETSQVTDMSYAFYRFTGTELIFGGKFDTSNVTDMSYMFHLCEKITDLDLSCFDTSNVENMYFMFSQDYYLVNLTGLENWNTGKVKDMTEMFYECYYMKTPAINNWDVSSVETFSYFMLGCYDVSELDLSSWNPKSARSMAYMFCMSPNSAFRPWEDCYSRLTSIGDVSGWDTSNVTNFSGMFSYGVSLEELPGIENWDTSSATTLSSMFYNCSSLTELDLSGWNTSNVNSYASMFSGCQSLEWLDVSGFVMKDSLTNNAVISMFGGDKVLREVELGPEFVFYPNANELPTPSGTRTTGRWMRIDGTRTPTGDAFTPHDLATNWDASYAGTWVWEEESYVINFDANGGSGSMAAHKVEKDQFNLPANEFVAPELLGETYTFAGWSVEKDGDVVLTDTELVSIGSDHTLRNASGGTVGTFALGTDAAYEITLYAKWSNLNYKLEYQLDDADAAAGATGSMPSEYLLSTAEYTIPTPTFFWLGHVVNGWKYTATDADGNITTGTFKRGEAIPAGKFSGGSTVVLTPTWANEDDVVEVKNGEFTVTLKGNQVGIIENQIPAGTEYEIYEETPDGWKLIAWSGDKGTIAVGETSDAYFTNMPVVEPMNRTLTITKIAEGADSNTAFTFEFTLSDAEGNPLSGSFSNVEFKEGKGTVTIKGSGSVALMGLPDGTVFSVTEVNLPDGWKLTSSEGTQGALTEDCTATFTNTKTTTPPPTPVTPGVRLPKTGDLFSARNVAIAAVVGVAAVGCGVYLSRRKKDDEK